MKMTFMKKLKGAAIGASIAALAISASAQQSPDIATTPAEWKAQGENTVLNSYFREEDNNEDISKRAKNVILFLGDGMGVTTITAARIFEGQKNGTEGEDNELFFETLPNVAMVKTYNTDVQVPDSAGTMTAIMTGVKTDQGVIGVNQDVVNGDCSTEAAAHATTALEMAEMIGMSTGVISTARITHATGASTYAHSMNRGYEDDHDDRSGDWRAGGCLDIAQQMIDMPTLMGTGDGLEVAMGGGREGFLPSNGTVPDPETGESGDREDNRDLTQEWLDNYSNSAYVWDKAGLEGVNTDSTKHLLGLFEPSHMQYETDRAYDVYNEVPVEATDPSLAQMTTTAIEILDNNNKGFFLVVEGGRIDHAHHDSNPYRALDDTIAFSDAVQAAYENTDPDDTLIIVTADHSHPMTIGGGYGTPKGNPVLGIGAVSFVDGLPIANVGYPAGAGFNMKDGSTGDRVIGRVDLTEIDTESPHFRPEALINYFEFHSSEDVVAYASGPGAELVNGLMEQNVLFHVMNFAAVLTEQRLGNEYGKGKQNSSRGKSGKGK